MSTATVSKKEHALLHAARLYQEIKKVKAVSPGTANERKLFQELTTLLSSKSPNFDDALSMEEAGKALDILLSAAELRNDVLEMIARTSIGQSLENIMEILKKADLSGWPLRSRESHDKILDKWST